MIANNPGIAKSYRFGNINILASQLNTHFKKWENWEYFGVMLRQHKIRKIYITGHDADPLLYKYLYELIVSLKEKSFEVGLRTNGVKALEQIKTINLCTADVEYMVHMAISTLKAPDWPEIARQTNARTKFSIVLNREAK